MIDTRRERIQDLERKLIELEGKIGGRKGKSRKEWKWVKRSLRLFFIATSLLMGTLFIVAGLAPLESSKTSQSGLTETNVRSATSSQRGTATRLSGDDALRINRLAILGEGLYLGASEDKVLSRHSVGKAEKAQQWTTYALSNPEKIEECASAIFLVFTKGSLRRIHVLYSCETLELFFALRSIYGSPRGPHWRSFPSAYASQLKSKFYWWEEGDCIRAFSLIYFGENPLGWATMSIEDSRFEALITASEKSIAKLLEESLKEPGRR